MRRQTLWIAFFAATATLGTSAVYADFIDDSQVQLKLRNFYLDRQYADVPENDWGSWSQGVTLDAKSGYYDLGGVEVGVDVLAQYAFKLDQLHDKPDFVLKYDGDRAKSGFGKIGATLKAKVSKTELKVGELLPVSPVLVYDPSRQLLTTFSGAWLESKDVKNTKLTLAYVNRINNRYNSSFEHLTKFAPPQYDNGAESKGMWIAGIDYQFSPAFGASYWFADVQDIYKQNYVGFNYNTDLTTNTKLISYARYFDNKASSHDLYGKIDNQAISASAKVVHGAHTMAVGYQQMLGDNAFPTLGGWVPQPYLVNWGVATFTQAKEKSWGFTYAYDFSNIGIKGFNTTATYFTGYDAEVAGKTGLKSNELNLIVNYTVPEGKLKGLGVQAMYIDADFDYKSDLKEYRVATTYNYKF